MKFQKNVHFDELAGAAKELITFADDRRIFLFHGDMGAGKTTFIKAICQELGVRETTSSPTFSIVQEYTYEGGLVYHFDFYRIREEQEAYDLGFEDYIYSGHYCLIEWPEKIENLLSQLEFVVNVHLDVTSPKSRSITAH